MADVGRYHHKVFTTTAAELGRDTGNEGGAGPVRPAIRRADFSVPVA
jgi:hypothetical protein